MTVIERERVTPLQPPERAVFVTDDDRRARRMRRGAFAATALACLWLVGLGLGMLGLGGLPGVSLIKPGRGEQQRSEAPQGRQAQQLTRRDGRLTRSERVLARQVASGGVVRASASQRVARSTRIARPAAPPAAAAPPAQQPVNPAQRTRGWARKGQPAPPGQVQKTQLPPPPPTLQGQHRGQTTTTTTWVPPGQAKKTTPPPPTG
jgi:hypothetical protein